MVEQFALSWYGFSHNQIAQAIKCLALILVWSQVKAYNASMTNGEYASTIGFASILYRKRRRIENTKEQIKYTL